MPVFHVKSSVRQRLPHVFLYRLLLPSDLFVDIDSVYLYFSFIS